MKRKKRLVSLLLAVVMCIGAVPYTASTVHAAGISERQTELTVNQSVVAFGGYEWWVIGNANGGVYQKADSVTLLAKTLQDEWRNVAFRTGSSSSFDNSSQYSKDNWYYANNPQSMPGWTSPNEYAGSTLQQKMESIANEFSEAEQSLINPRNFTGDGAYQEPSVDGIAGQGLNNQKVWPLSDEEWNTIGDNTVRKYGDMWWLRSGSSYYRNSASQSLSDGIDRHSPYVYGSGAVRPALNLNLKSVLFTSAASGGKSSATVGSNLVGASAPTGTVKFTMKDASQTLTVGSITSNACTLQGTYSGATTGNNQYISCVLTDETGAVKYYGKLADSSNAASGTFSIPLSGVVDGKYTLKIFSEEANGDLYTDFCSEPVTMTLTVSDGNGTVSGFSGTIHSHVWSTAWSSDGTAHWHECTADDCPTTNNSKKDGYAEHIYDQKVADDSYKAEEASCTTAATYYKSCVCGKNGTETFTNGSALGHNNKGNIAHKDATCTENGVVGGTYCTRCNEGKDTAEMVIPVLGHEYGNWSSNGNGTHSRTCTRNGCTETQMEDCTGGAATCQSKAVCTECKTEYGEKDPSNHTGEKSWVQTETTHQNVYSCCNTPISEAENHKWKNGTCTVCQYPCKHTGGKATCTQKAVCEICNSQYGEINPNNHKPSSEWTWENGRHYHVCENGCDTHLDERECFGGIATCTKKALCEVCGHAYGDYGKHDVTEHKANGKTCTQDGNSLYWSCSVCGKYYSDASGLTEIEENSWIIPASHEYEWVDEKPASCTENGIIGHYFCGSCGKNFSKTGEVYTELSEADMMIPAAHAFGAWTDEVPATCVKEGTKGYKTCTVCGKYFDADGNEIMDLTLPVNKDNHIHTENKPETPAGCETVGYTAGVYCTDCGAWVSGHEEISATGHGELKTEKAKEATCTDEGYTGDKVCKVCGEVVEAGQTIAKTAHAFKGGKCTVCGATDPDYVPATPDDPDDENPQTGDSSNLALWFTLMGVGAAGLCGALLLQKRRGSKVK